MSKRNDRILSVFAMLVIVVSMVWTQTGYAQNPQKNIILTTTTSVQDSGLLDELLPVFEKQTGYVVKTIAVGSGQAMAMGKRGEADVLIVHSPKAEEEFVKEGYGINRALIMHNYFVLVGPTNNPAKIVGTKSAKEAFKKIADSGSLFVSRGDNSGTNALEKKIWQMAGISTEGKTWYQQTGLGMGQTIGVANEKLGYTLTDKATFLYLKKNLQLAMLLEESEDLYNGYSVIELNPQKFSKINIEGGKAFAKFILSKKAQNIIKNYGIKKCGESLFFPDALAKSKNKGRK
ncbi:MAG: substrate-binding domain-containing protein [Deltaproteobacteria bacterium]